MIVPQESKLTVSVLGPIIGGFVTQYLGWRWANWIVLILGGIATALMCLIKETYSPRLLQIRAKRRRKEGGEEKHWSRYDQRVGFIEMMKVNLSRPFVMAVKEPICIFWNVYIAIIYGKHVASLLVGDADHVQDCCISVLWPTRSSSKVSGAGALVLPVWLSSASGLEV